MKAKVDEKTERYLLILRSDAKNLCERILQRRDDYIDDFSLKRDRDVFKDIFDSRYAGMSAFDLSHYPSEVLELADTFYQDIDELYWYLLHTQDMPNTILDTVSHHCVSIDKKFQELVFYIDAVLSGNEKQISTTYSQRATP